MGAPSGLVRALVAAAVLLGPLPAGAATEERPSVHTPRLVWRGELFDLHAPGQPLLFRFLQWESPDGSQVLSAYHDPSGRLLTTESLLLDERGLVRYEVQHLEAGRRGVVERVDGRVRLTTAHGDERRTREDRFDDRLVVGLLLPRFITARWDALLAGETAIARYPLMDRTRIIDLRIRKAATETRAGEERVVFEIRPRSRLLSFLADPVRMVFDGREREIREVVGRAVPLRRTDGDWEPVDARGVYERVRE